MSIYSLGHVSDRDLLLDLASSVAQDRTTMALLLARIAEVDARRLYAPAGFPSMYLYCVHELHLSEEAARKRIHAARTARQFPAIFDAVADGRLHLTAVNRLAPYLTPENADALLKAAADKTGSEIGLLLAERFPRSEMLPLVQVIPASAAQRDDERPAGQVETHASDGVGSASRRAPERVAAAPRPNVTPIAQDRFFIQFTTGRETHDDLQYAHALLSHQIPPGDVEAVIARALKALIREQEKRRFAATNQPRTSHRRRTSKRHIPAHVRRAVWERDRGQCTFVSSTGQRCPARTLLQFDHIVPVALGGQATVEGIRIRCASHNQYAAERTFGVDFMRNKREEARRAREEARRARAAARAAAASKEAEARERAGATAERAKELDVVPWLRELGFRADEARRAAVHCDKTIPDGPLEERVRAALRFLSPPARRWHPPATSTPVAAPQAGDCGAPRREPGTDFVRDHRPPCRARCLGVGRRFALPRGDRCAAEPTRSPAPSPLRAPATARGSSSSPDRSRPRCVRPRG